MVCPFCADQALVVISTVSGTVERCPSCMGFFVPWDMLAKFSDNPEKFIVALNEGLPLLFPTGRICPHCYGRLCQGRLPGHEMIVSLCVACRLIWTDPTDLDSLDPLMAQALRAQIEKPSVPTVRKTHPKPVQPGSVQGFFNPEAAQNPGFQSFPELIPSTSAADLEKHKQALEKELRESWGKREEELMRRHAEEMKKAHDALDQTLRQKLSATEAEQTQRLASLQKNIADLEKGRADQETHLKELKKRLESMEKQRAVSPPAPLKIDAPPPLEIPPSKPLPEIPKGVPVVEKPAVAPLPPAPKSFIAKKPSLWTTFSQQMKQLWTPPAKKSAIKPLSETPKPVFTASKPVVPAPQPVSVPKTEPAVQLPPKPVVVKKKSETAWIDVAIVWTPRILPVIVFLIAGFVEEDWGQACLWAAAVWAVSAMVRLWRIYPSKFKETTLAELSALPIASLKGGVPVLLKGRLESETPHSLPMVFKDATGSLPLNLLGPLDLIPRLFGLISAGQFPKDEFELKGWYRRPKTPFIEAAEARHEKTLRKSLVKPLRWAGAAAVLFFAVLLLFVIE